MGKTRRHKTRYAAKSNPLGDILNGSANGNGLFDAVNDDDDGGGEFEPARPVDAVREQLLNANVEEKLNGLQSFAVLAASKDKVIAICNSDLVRIAAPLLCERNEAVRNAAAGALRNLSVCGPDVCEYLVEQDVLTPLLALLAEYTTQDAAWTPSFDASMGGQLDLHADVFLQGINLLWNLCESTSVALDTFNQTSLLAGLIRCLDWRVFGLDIGISVAQCLLVVSENNPKSWNVLNQHVPELLSLLSATGGSGEADANGHGHAFLRTLAAGILSNVPALSAAYAATMLTALGQTLEIDHRVALSDNGSETQTTATRNGQAAAPELEIKMDTADDETEEAAALRRRRQDLPTEADIAVRNLGYLLDAQRVAAEVITNLCSAEEEEWEDAEEEEGSESESVVDCEMSRNDSETNLHDSDKLSVDVVEAIKSIGLVDKLWQRAQPIADSLAQQLRESNTSLLMKAKNLRISSLLCLQNLCNSLSAEDLGGPTAIYTVWVDLGQQVFKGPKDQSVLEPSTSLMRSSLEHLKTNKELFGQMTESDLELMLNGVTNCTMPEIRANWLRMLGTLGCLLPETLVKMIIKFIVKTCAEEEDVWTISEALDALMDMFSDNDWNQIVLDLNLPVVIGDLEKNFKSKVRQQRRELKERYPAVQTVRTNLTRFVKYMEKEALTYANSKTTAQTTTTSMTS